MFIVDILQSRDTQDAPNQNCSARYRAPKARSRESKDIHEKRRRKVPLTIGTSSQLYDIIGCKTTSFLNFSETNEMRT